MTRPLLLLLRRWWEHAFDGDAPRCRKCFHRYSEWFVWDGVRYCYPCHSKTGEVAPRRWMLCVDDILNRYDWPKGAIAWHDAFLP